MTASKKHSIFCIQMQEHSKNTTQRPEKGEGMEKQLLLFSESTELGKFIKNSEYTSCSMREKDILDIAKYLKYQKWKNKWILTESKYCDFITMLILKNERDENRYFLPEISTLEAMMKVTEFKKIKVIERRFSII